MRICNVENCNRIHEARGYCKNHYKSFIKHGNALFVDEANKTKERERAQKEKEKYNKPTQHSTEGVCSVDGCNMPIKAKLLCDKHYTRIRRNGTLEVNKKALKIETDRCLVIGCNNSHKRNGMCTTHISYQRAHGTPYLFKIIKQCGVKGCNREHLAKGMCQKHYREWSLIKEDYGLE